MLENILGSITGTENTESTATESENIFAGLTDGFQGIVDMILYIINSIREMIESIVNG